MMKLFKGKITKTGLYGMRLREPPQKSQSSSLVSSAVPMT